MSALRRAMAGFIILAMSVTFYSSAYAQDNPAAERTITRIAVKNNNVISQETVLLKVRTKVGDKFSQDTINDDIKRLYATQYFLDVSVDVEEYNGGVAVTFIVEEKPVIDDVVFTGNKAISTQKLRSTIKSKPDEMLNLTMLSQDMAEIKAMYVKKGYPLIDVNYDISTDKELNKATITIIVEEKARVKVVSVNVTGCNAIKAGEIRKILGTKPAWLFNQGVFKDEVLEDDIEKIKSMYDDKGFLDTSVTPKLDYSDDGTKLSVTFEVAEGKQYMVGDVTVTGNLVLPENKVKAKIKVKKSKPFSARALRDDLINLREYYYEFGYMNSVVDAERVLNPDTGNIDIAFKIEGKDPVYVGKIDIRGNVKTRELVVRRELRIYPGERFDGAKIKRSKERIYNLGLFENVTFDTEPTDDPAVQNLIVGVKETKTGEFSFGGGYSSIDMLMGFIEVTQRNFDILNFPTFMGGGQNLSLKAELGMVSSNYDISWTDPWIFGFPYAFGFDLYRTEHNKRGDLGWIYDETRWGGDLRLGKEFTDTFRGDMLYRLEDVNISNIIDNASQDVKDEAGSNWISSLTLALTQDTRDNIYNPGKGYLIGFTIEDAGGIFLGDKNFFKGTLSASYYHTFFNIIVLELKGRGGMGGAYGSTAKMPIYERFYAGGANTIRGYKERRVGPRDPGSNEPIGGDSILVANTELTFPIYERMIKGAVFYDIGNVWRSSNQFMNGGYKQGVGVGVRVKTPIGPVRLDYGWPLNKNYDDDQTGELYFSMSRGF